MKKRILIIIAVICAAAACFAGCYQQSSQKKADGDLTPMVSTDDSAPAEDEKPENPERKHRHGHDRLPKTRPDFRLPPRPEPTPEPNG